MNTNVDTVALVAGLLKRGDFVGQVEWARAWGPKASHSDIRELLAEFQEADRAKLTALLRDVLTSYPTCRWGVPTVIRYFVQPGANLAGDELILPVPATQPAEGVQWVKWLDPRAVIEDTPLCSPPSEMRIKAGISYVVVLMIGLDNPDDMVFTDSFMSDLFAGIPAQTSVRVAARAALPLPDAIEFAALALPGVRRFENSYEDDFNPQLDWDVPPVVFLREAAHELAREVVQTWRGNPAIPLWFSAKPDI